MPMAAHQRRKLLNGTAKLESRSSEISRTRMKHARPTEDCFNTKSHVTLEWDANKKHVIAIKEQIGISWRNLRPFFDSLPRGCEILADTFEIPGEIFELDNLEEVLSQEVWQTCLSESERKYLRQFLPVEAEVQHIVKPLFAGDNFHFGNPLLQWGSSLRSGNMHPDAIVAREHRLKTEKKAYYSDLRKYHIDIIGCLLKLKESWESFNDTEGISAKIWRSEKDGRRKFSSSSNGFVVEDGISASSESSSCAADETTDNHQSAILRSGKSHQRMNQRARKKGLAQTLPSIDDGHDTDLWPINGEKMWRTGALCDDGAKYMSYIMISKKQHEIAKNMERSGDSIHSKSLGPLLGDLQNYHIQPYEVFLEEERKKLNEHWLGVAKDLPSIYASWRNHQFNKHQIILSLKQELEEKLDSLMEEIEEASVEKFSDQKHEEGYDNSSDGKQDIEESVLECQVNQNDDDDGTCGLAVGTTDEEYEHGGSQHRQSAQGTQNRDNVEANSEDSSKPESAQQQEEISPFLATSGHTNIINGHGVPPISDDPEMPKDGITFRSGDSPRPHVSAHSPKSGTPDMIISCGVPLASGSLEVARNQITVKPEDARKIAAVSGYSPMSDSTNIINSHGVSFASSVLEAQRNQITLKTEDARKPADVSVYSAAAGPTNMITSHGVPLASSVLEAQRSQISLKPDDARRTVDVSLHSARLVPTNMIDRNRIPIASGGIEAQRNEIALKSLDARQPEDVSAYSARLDNHAARHISDGDIWQPVSVLPSSYGSTAGYLNSSAAELTLPEPSISGAEHRGPWNDVESSLPAPAELLQGQINQGSFKSYTEQDQNDLLQSILKGQGVISYNHEPKYASVTFEQSNSVLVDNSQLPVHFHKQPSLPLSMEPGHEAGNASYMQQNVGVISNLGSFPLPRQQQLLPPNIQDWPENSVRFPESLPCSVAGDDLSSQSWFAGEGYVRGGWSASDSNCTPSQCLGNMDQSLYSVLSPCNQLRSATSYNSIDPTDRIIPARNYRMVGGGNIPDVSDVLPHSARSLDCMNRQDSTNALISDGTGWMNLPQQNPSLNDSTGKPFMESWNQ